MINWLPSLIELEDYDYNWEAYINEINNIFEQDFNKTTPVKYNNLEVKIKFQPCSKGKGFTFWHITSTGCIENQRLPDLERCKRIKWVKAVLQNYTDPNVLVWEKTDRGTKKVLFFLQDEKYLVVLASRKNYYLLQTAYFVSNNHYCKKLIKEYNDLKS